jgi:hypothetical protein
MSHDGLTDAARVDLLKDPVLWAETYLQDPNLPHKPLRLRWYQRKILRDNSQRRILRMGRRTGKTAILAVVALYNAFTYKNRQILCTAAYDSQVQEIFEQMLRMVENSPLLKEGVERTRQRPFEIWLSNGSLIRGMVANNTVRGKCLPNDTMVFRANNEPIKIQELRPGDKVLSWNEAASLIEAKEVVGRHNNGMRPVWEITTVSNRKIRATGDHKMYIMGKGWIPIEEAKPLLETSLSESDFIGLMTLSGGAKWARVRSMEMLGTMQTWDLEVEDNHNFVAFWPDMDPSKSPFSITGLVDGGFIVHNSAHVVIGDELDYMDQKLLKEAVWPVTTTFKDTEVIVSSTPSGRREFFFDISMNQRKYGFSEHHYPSTNSPEWTPEFEQFAKETTTAAQFAHEYLAEFGEAAEGVYKHKLVDDAMYAYDYDELTVNPNNHYTLGVDWNEAAQGVQGVVLEFLNDPIDAYKYDPTFDTVAQEPIKLKHKWRVFRTFAIDAEHMTNLTAVDEVISWLKRIPISYSCFDRGHGYTNYELIRTAIDRGVTATGKKAVGLTHHLDNMASVNFAASFDIIDPIDNTVTQHRTKNVMVRNSVKQFENHNILIPAVKNDEKHTIVENDKLRLIGQLRDYVVERIGDRGEVYSKGNDHRLDAFNLALHGFLLNRDLFMHWQMATRNQAVADHIQPGISKTVTRMATGKRKVGGYRPSVKATTVTDTGMRINDFGKHPMIGEPPDAEDISSTSTAIRNLGHIPRANISKRGSRRI